MKRIICLLISVSLTGCFNSSQVNKVNSTNTKVSDKKQTLVVENKVFKSQISGARPVVVGLRKADIMIIFKDSEKIRFNFNENKFYSIKNIDVSKLNFTIKDYKIRLIEPHDTAIGKSEEDLEIAERNNEKSTG